MSAVRHSYRDHRNLRSADGFFVREDRCQKIHASVLQRNDAALGVSAQAQLAKRRGDASEISLDGASGVRRLTRFEAGQANWCTIDWIDWSGTKLAGRPFSSISSVITEKCDS